MKWFKHSGTASRDARVAKLMTEYGIEGYGLYFYCIELIASKTDSDDLTFELEHDAGLIAAWTKMDTLQVEKIMHRCIELGLFDIADNGHLTCFKLIKWIDRKLVGEKTYSEMVGRIGENPRKSPMIPVVDGENPLLLDEKREDETRREGTDKKHPPKKTFGEFENVSLSDAEFSKLLGTYGESQTETIIEKLSASKAMNPKLKYASDMAAIRKWVIEAVGAKPLPPPAPVCPLCGHELSDNICPNAACPQYEEGYEPAQSA